MPSDKLTSKQVKEAVQQMIVSCDLKMENYKAKLASYDAVSARGLLYELGYDSGQADQVIKFLFQAGFNYCIDAMFPVKDPDTGVEEPTPQFACAWGPDQLKSRLHWCV